LVVALHGWQRTSSDFDAILGVASGMPDDPFSGKVVPSIALDLPGFGVSPPPPTAWSTLEYATALIPFLEELEHPVVLLGHSFGGRVAIQLGAAAPGLVRGLVLTGVPIRDAKASKTTQPNWRFRLLRRGAKLGVVSEDRIEAARQRYGSRDYREAVGVMRGVLVSAVADDYLPLLGRITAPVELVWGEGDSAAPVSGARAAVSVLRDAHLQVLPGIGHMVPLEAPQALRHALGRWSH
jgi:pimeloyl-ACP methyl ester carboxylesterase